jgi:limonene-1,2-epoxide hydrolase
MPTPTEIVLDFIDAWNKLDLPRAIGLMAPDIFYHNIPMAPAKGLAEVQALFATFPPFKGCDWTVHHLAANGPVVLTERTDRFQLESGKWASVRVMGTFEINADGKIQAWRDYFDLAEMMREFGG